jgi:hypothetical protein
MKPITVTLTLSGYHCVYSQTQLLTAKLKKKSEDDGNRKTLPFFLLKLKKKIPETGNSDWDYFPVK